MILKGRQTYRKGEKEAERKDREGEEGYRYAGIESENGEGKEGDRLTGRKSPK